MVYGAHRMRCSTKDREIYGDGGGGDSDGGGSGMRNGASYDKYCTNIRMRLFEFCFCFLCVGLHRNSNNKCTRNGFVSILNRCQFSVEWTVIELFRRNWNSGNYWLQTHNRNRIWHGKLHTHSTLIDAFLHLMLKNLFGRTTPFLANAPKMEQNSIPSSKSSQKSWKILWIHQNPKKSSNFQSNHPKYAEPLILVPAWTANKLKILSSIWNNVAKRNE